MASSPTIQNHIQGLDGVLEKMRALGPALAKKGARTAMRKGANIVRDDAKKRVPVGDPTKHIRDEIEVRFSSRTFKRTGDVMFRVGVKGGAKKYVDDKKNRRLGRVGKDYEGGGNVYYWRFVEFGTSKMAARPFMRPALSENVDKVTNVAVVELNKALDRAAKKAGI